MAVIAAVVLLYSSGPLLQDRFFPAINAYLPWSGVPHPGFEAAQAPLGTPPPAPPSNAYALQPSPSEAQDFAAYDPCRPVHYVSRPDNAPPGADQLLDEAVAIVSAATGLRFVDDGFTDEGPSDERETFQPERYGERWAPVLVAWSDTAETPNLAGDVAGLGGSAYAHTAGQPFVLVAGQVVMDAPDLAPDAGSVAGRAAIRGILVHELAHVLGLDHVDDPNQLMYGGPNQLTELADGDRAGLALLGTGACVPQL